MESVALWERSVLLEVQVLFDLVSNFSATAGPEHAPHVSSQMQKWCETSSIFVRRDAALLGRLS
jgi:hypothetical protein